MAPEHGPCKFHTSEFNFSGYDYPYRKETWTPITWVEITKVSRNLIFNQYTISRKINEYIEYLKIFYISILAWSLRLGDKFKYKEYK